jgi:class 3 adenylate cyclase/tetratricopeptide (TPR) repeat protein
MQCPTCGHENREAAKFCVRCGRGLSVSCASCGAPLPGGATFCDECGTPVKQRAGATPPDRTPRDYTPKHLAEKILTSKSALEGERKQVTVLFADVKGSLDLAEQVDPEEWHRILNRFFEILSDGVHRFEGTVNQYTGDGIMALFGAPIAHEDHAQRACYAALHLREELRRYGDALRLEQGLNFSVRMGLNSGEVIVGKIGDDLRMDYTAQGHTVGLAARMEQLAEPGNVFLTEHTTKLVEGYFALRDVGASRIEGLSEPIHVFELEGVGELRTRLDVSRARGLSRFVGRAEETETLERALTRAIEGKAQVVGVVGDAGVGKSRLCFEFVDRCRARGLRVRETHGVAHGKSIPFLPVLDFLRGFFGVTERDRDEEARRKIAGTLLLLDRELTETLPLLFEFLGVPDPKQPAPRMDPEARQRNLFALVRRTLQARRREEPGVILIEDLHWFDGGSEAFLEVLVEAVPGTRTLLAVNFRPEYHAGWMQKSYYQQLALLPLGAAEIKELLDHLLGRHSSLEGLAGHIQARTGGNPFFIEELVQSLVESGSLEGTQGAYRLKKSVEEVALPASVQAVLGARIDRLQEREKHLLQTASVIGKEFAEPVLKRVAELPDIDLAESLRALTRAEFIYEHSLYPELEYAFKHRLTQEVAYRSQLGDRRGRIHAAVGRAIEELYPEKLDERAALLAHHWESAGEQLEAARWHARAGEWTGLRDPGEALRHWRQARSLLEEVPASPETVGLGLMARIQILNFGWRLGLSEDESAKVFTEGKALAEQTANPHTQAILLFTYSAIKALGGQPEESLRLGMEALRLAEEAGDPGLKLVLRVGAAYSLMNLGRLREALPFVDKNLETAPGDPRLGAEIAGFSPYIQTFILRSMILTFMGHPKDARRDLDRTLQLAQEHGDTEIVGWSHGWYVGLAETSGETQGILDHARRALEISEKIGSAFSRAAARWSLGLAHKMDKEWTKAREALEGALNIVRESRTGLLIEGRLLSYLAEIYLNLDQERLARETADEGIAVHRRHHTKLYECPAHLAKAHVLSCTEGARSRDAIEAALAQARSLVQETEAKCWEPFIHEECAELARLLGDDATHQRELREAHRLFTEMEATGHAARLAKELGL